MENLVQKGAKTRDLEKINRKKKNYTAGIMNERGVSRTCHQSVEKKRGGLFPQPSQEREKLI